MPFPEFEYNNPYTNDAGSIAKKKQGIVKASRQKKDQLDPTWNTGIFDDALLHDADTYAGQRLGTNQPDRAFDAFETTDKKFVDGKNAAQHRQRQALFAAEILNKPVEEITDQDIFVLGEQQATKASDLLFEGQENYFIDGTTEGPVRPNESESGMPIVETKQKGIGYYGRPVVEMRNPITGKSLLDALNTPQDNIDFNSPYNRAGRDAYNQTPEGKERILENTNRTNEEVIKDLTAGAAKFGVNTGATLYGLGDLSTQGSDLKNLTTKELVEAMINPAGFAAKQAIKAGKSAGESLFGKPQFAETNKLIDKALLSDQTKLSQKKLANQMAKHDEGSEARKEKWIADKKFTPFGAEVMDLGLGIINGIEAGIDNPLALQDILVTSAPQLLTGGIVGRAAVSKAITAKTANMTKAEVSTYMASKEGRKLVDNVVTRTGIATEAVQESMINGIHKQEAIMGMTHDDLMKTSEQYQSNIARGMEQDAAKLDVANKVFNTTATVTAIISSGASKFTGTGKATGKMFVADPTTAGGKFKTALVKAAKTGDKILGEGVQETIQEGGSKLAENIAEKAYIDKEQKLLEGVGTSAGLGALAGVATAGGVHGITDTVKAVKGSAKLAGKGAKKVVEKGQTKVRSYVEDKEDKVIVDPKAEAYDADAALNVTIKKGTRDTDIDTFQENITTHAKEVLNSIGEDIDKINLELKDNKADPNLLVKKKNLETKKTETIASVREQMQDIANQKAYDAITKTTTEPTKASESDIQATSASIRTSDRFGSEQLDSIIANKGMPAPVVESAKLRKAFNTLDKKVNSNYVQNEILRNKQKNISGKRSVTGFRDDFKVAIESGNIPEARKLYKEMSKWRDYQTDKLTKLQNLKPGQTAKYSDQDGKYSFKRFADKKGELAYKKLISNVKLEADYMNKYLALMAEKGKAATGKAPAELKIENIEFGVSEEDVISQLEFETPIKASVSPSKPVTEDVDTIVTPVAKQESVIEEKPVSQPVKESPQIKVEPTTDTNRSFVSDLVNKTEELLAESAEVSIPTELRAAVNNSVDTLQAIRVNKKALGDKYTTELNKAVKEVNTAYNDALDASVNIAKPKIEDKTTKKLNKLAKSAQDRMKAINSIKECL